MSDVPPALAALYERERAAPGPTDADRERIRNAVLVSVGVTVTTAAAATTTASSGIAGKLVVVCLAIGAIGGGAALMSRNHTSDVGKQTVTTQPRVSREAPVTTPPIVSLPTPPPPPSPTPPPVTRPHTSSSRVERVVAPEESDARRLARAVALSERGDAAGALALLDGVASTSALAEERDALRVRLLSKLGRTDDACAAVTSFVARYPDSIHRAAVEEVPCANGR